MARYRVIARSFINSALREVGDVIEFNGEAGANLAPLDPVKAEAKAAKAPASDK